MTPKARLTLMLLQLAYATSWTLTDAYSDVLPILDEVYPDNDNNDADLRRNLQVLNTNGYVAFLDATGTPCDRPNGTGRYRWAT